MRSTDFAHPATYLPNIMGANKRTHQMSGRANGGGGSKAQLEGTGAQRGHTVDDGRPTATSGWTDGMQGGEGGEEAYPGVQASHLGVYRHDTGVNLMRYNGQPVPQ